MEAQLSKRSPAKQLHLKIRVTTARSANPGFIAIGGMCPVFVQGLVSQHVSKHGSLLTPNSRFAVVSNDAIWTYRSWPGDRLPVHRNHTSSLE